MALQILVTGGAGYIGSHTVVELLQAGHSVVVLDNLCNGSRESLARAAQLTGRPAPLVEGDLRDRAVLDRVLASDRFDAVIHFAGLKAVGESVAKPIDYYDNNLIGTLSLLRAMDAAGVRRLVFSSSATVYGDPQRVPIDEQAPTAPTNPYGRTKWMIEFMLRDLAHADSRWSIANLRYFNPVGAHPSARMGEDPEGVPNNLVPFIAQVAVGRLERLRVFGGDWPTPDGTGVRDYIHVLDLAQGHVAALDRLRDAHGFWTVNLGTGRGYSVLEMVAAFERASGRPIPYDIVDRRPGDIATCYADASRAAALLGWRATRGIDEMCADTWRWQRHNPQGYQGPEDFNERG